MPSGTGLDLFQKKFPDRMFDVGIAEQHGVTFAAGLATEDTNLMLLFTQLFYKELMIRLFMTLQYNLYQLDLPLIEQA